MTTHHHVSEEMRRCAAECHRCHDVCLETISHCLHVGGKHAEPHHIRLLMDCVQICHASAGFMLRGSDLHAVTCRACTEVCRRCAEDCARVGGDDPQMSACAAQCRRCAESCWRMAAGG